MFDQKIEQELKAGDELVRELKQGSKSMSESTCRQFAAELQMLQAGHRWFKKLSPKKMAIIGVISFFVGIGLFRLGLYLEGALPVNSYTADSNSYEYRRGQEVNGQIGMYMATGIMLVLLPIGEVGLYFFLRSRSRRYTDRLVELKAILSKAS